jgi:hypothetical protein
LCPSQSTVISLIGGMGSDYGTGSSHFIAKFVS